LKHLGHTDPKGFVDELRHGGEPAVMGDSESTHLDPIR